MFNWVGRFFIAWMLCGVLSSGAFAGPVPLPTTDFEGVYDLRFKCPTTRCAGTAAEVTRLVVMSTGRPSLLGGGQGLVVSLLMPNIGPAFFFVGATYDPVASTVVGVSESSSIHQPGRVILHIDAAGKVATGILRDLNSSDDTEFEAAPVQTVERAFPDVDGFTLQTEDIEGQYGGSWVDDGAVIIKALRDDVDGLTYAAKFESDDQSFRRYFHDGFVTPKKGLLALVGTAGRYPIKLWVAYAGRGKWAGFTIASGLGVIRDFKMKKKIQAFPKP
jgi:hypothetical protein